MTLLKAICLLGFGEVGQILATEIASRCHYSISVWDTQFEASYSKASQARVAHSLREYKTAEEAVAEADIVISAVTAAETLKAAQSVVSGLKHGAWYLDLNSASPAIKSKAANFINNVGGRYVEAAVMSPISPKHMNTPMLFGGPFAKGFLSLSKDMGFGNAKMFSEEYGKASAAKMCRSVIVKGIEALLTEALITARQYGVEDTVLTSLQDLFPGPDWATLSHYMVSRSILHGKRRAEEMREVVKTVADTGLEPLMSAACAQRHDIASAWNSDIETATIDALLDSIIDGNPMKKDT